MSAEAMMVDSCTLNSKSAAPSSSGFPTITTATGTTTYPCMVDVTSDESMEGGRESPTLRGQIYLPYGTTVGANHIILVSTGLHAGRVFEINGTPVDDTGRQTHLVCEVRSALDGLR